MTPSSAEGGRPPLRIAITNAVLSNTGDAAICAGLVETLVAAGVTTAADVVVFDADARSTAPRYPGWRVHQQLTVSPPRRVARLRTRLQRLRLALARHVITKPEQARRVLGCPVLQRSAFARSLRALDGVDAVVSSGGTYLVDHYDFGPRVVELELAASRDVPVVLWTQSLGPFQSPRARRDIRRIAPLVTGVWFRDERSATNWAGVAQLPGTRGVVPDAAFALGVVVPPAAQRPIAEPPLAIVSVRRWGHTTQGAALDAAAYAGAVRAGVTHLLSSGWRVRALSTCQGVARYAFDDSQVAAELLVGLPVDVDRGFYTPQQLLHELDAADLVVSTRMHLAILALLRRVPVVAIAYEFKTLELFRGLGLGDLVIPIEEADERGLRARIDTLREDPERGRVDPDRLAALAAEAGAPARALADLLGTAVPPCRHLRMPAARATS